MDTKTRAEKIAEQIVRESRQDQFCLAVAWCDHLKTWIEESLRAVDKEAYDAGRLSAQYDNDTLPEQIAVLAFNLGEQRGLEKAAGMVKEYMGPWDDVFKQIYNRIADEIRRIG